MRTFTLQRLGILGSCILSDQKVSVPLPMLLGSLMRKLQSFCLASCLCCASHITVVQFIIVCSFADKQEFFLFSKINKFYFSDSFLFCLYLFLTLASRLLPSCAVLRLTVTCAVCTFCAIKFLPLSRLKTSTSNVCSLDHNGAEEENQ